MRLRLRTTALASSLLLLAIRPGLPEDRVAIRAGSVRWSDLPPSP